MRASVCANNQLHKWETFSTIIVPTLRLKVGKSGITNVVYYKPEAKDCLLQRVDVPNFVTMRHTMFFTHLRVKLYINKRINIFHE